MKITSIYVHLFSISFVQYVL